jgi:hypothetical protein
VVDTLVPSGQDIDPSLALLSKRARVRLLGRDGTQVRIVRRLRLRRRARAVARHRT